MDAFEHLNMKRNKINKNFKDFMTFVKSFKTLIVDFFSVLLPFYVLLNAFYDHDFVIHIQSKHKCIYVYKKDL